MKKYKNKIIYAVLAVAILAVAYFTGGNPSDTQVSENSPTPVIATVSPDPTPSPSFEAEGAEDAKIKTEVSESTKIPTAPFAEETKAPEPQESPEPALSCTLSVRCDTILNNLNRLKPEKRGLVTNDGIILSARTVTFSDGESVFDLLTRELKNNKIHIEFNKTANGSAYIEGINNIYEFDCGDLSGWQYKVNEKVPGVSCSDYYLNQGDIVEWVYTCDFGNDI